MSFKENKYQQISMSDSFNVLTSREQKALENSWARVFSEEIFPAIDEERFSVLYSDKASRPNTPVNILIGANIIKELFDYSDDEMVENLMLDLHLQYALHTTSYEEQPLSDKSLSRFRKRCYDYEELYGIDLYRDVVTDLGDKIAQMMLLNGRIRRMDSLMIESNMKKLTRMELLYSCIARLIQYLSNTDSKVLPDGLKHYADPNDYNQVVYHQRSTSVDERIKLLLSDSEELLKLCQTGCEDVAEYELFIRCISEQTIIENNTRRLCTKEDRKLHSHVLLNPTDPDATFRTKAKKNYQGYVANIEETVGVNGSVITDYDYKQNTYADTSFLKDRIEKLPVQEEATIMIADGAYRSQELSEQAGAKNITLVNTGITGNAVKEITKKFKLNEEGTKIVECPGGFAPKSCCYKPSDGNFKLSFQKEQCANCPYQKECGSKPLRKVNRLYIHKRSFNTLNLVEEMQSEKFNNLRRIRNGVETVPSNLRHNYHLDKLPRGIQRGKYFFGSKIAALNFRKLFNYRKGLGNYAQNPLLA